MNKAIIVGRLVRDVEVRKTQSGLSTATFTVAVDRRRTSKDAPKEADFISCVAWRQTADFLGNYGKKGQMVGIDGHIQVRNYEKDGNKVYVTEIVVENAELLGGRPEGGAAPAPAAAAAEKPAEAEGVLDVEDDLPF